eukprot:scaffold803_cov310-Pinguiococcus_pyrenoidosus.AAC.10
MDGADGVMLVYNPGSPAHETEIVRLLRPGPQHRPRQLPGPRAQRERRRSRQAPAAPSKGACSSGAFR